MSSTKEMKSLITNMTAEQKAVNLNALTYIKTLASNSNINISEWNILKIFAKDDGVNLISDKKQINKVFFEQLEEVKKNKKPEDVTQKLQTASLEVEKIKTAFIDSAKKVRNTEINNLKNSLTYQEDQVRRLQVQLDQGVKAYAEIAKKVSAFEEVTDLDDKYLKSLKGVQKLISEELWVNPVYEDGYLYLNTNTNVMLHEVNKSANLDLHVDFGQLAVKIDIQNAMRFSVIPYKNNITVGGYFHPHVQPEGNICWGEAATAAMKNIASLELEKALRLLHALLNSYNGASPYMQLHRFKLEGQKLSRVGDTIKHPDKRKKAKEEALNGVAPVPLNPGIAVAPIDLAF